MQNASDVLPAFVLEQQKLSQDTVFQLRLSALGEKISSEKRRTIFISHAWNLPKHQDKYNEQWGDQFVKQMATDLATIGFDVFLDTEEAGIGVALNGTMKKGIAETDHVLLVLTNTYFYKVTERPWSGVSKELDYIIDRIDKMGGATIAGECRFVLPFLAVPRIPGFPLVESHGGFAGTYLANIGYENALIDTWNKLYSQHEALKPTVDNLSEFSGYLKAAKHEFKVKLKDVETDGSINIEAIGTDAVLENVKSKKDQTVFAVDSSAAMYGIRSGGDVTVKAYDSSKATEHTLSLLDRMKAKK